MPLTKKQKDNLKLFIKEKIGLDVYKISAWNSLYQDEHPEEENYSLYFAQNKGHFLRLKKQTANNNFVLTFTAESSFILSCFFHLINKGIYAKLSEIINLMSSKSLTVIQEFEIVELAAGDLSNLDDSLDIKWSFLLTHLHMPSDNLLNFSTYVTENENSVVVKSIDENMTVLTAYDDDDLNLEKMEVAVFEDKENALRHLMLSFIECMHYMSNYHIPLEHTLFEHFENIKTLNELMDYYKKEKTVQDMLDI